MNCPTKNQTKAIGYSCCYSAIGSAGEQAGTFGVCVGLLCMCAKVRGWPLCQRKATRKQPNAL